VVILFLGINKKINEILNKIADLKNSINTLKTKISNNEDIANSYFENVLTQLENCYLLIMVNVIEIPVYNSDI
jgi:archaellum component FlaC